MAGKQASGQSLSTGWSPRGLRKATGSCPAGSRDRAVSSSPGAGAGAADGEPEAGRRAVCGEAAGRARLTLPGAGCSPGGGRCTGSGRHRSAGSSPPSALPHLRHRFPDARSDSPSGHQGRLRPRGIRARETGWETDTGTDKMQVKCNQCARAREVQEAGEQASRN